MWRKALVGIVLLLPGCATFGDFLGDSFTYGTNPNLPAGNAENMRRVMGLDTPVGILRTEPGNVWPTGVQTAPTLQELERDNGNQAPAAPSPDMSGYLPGQQRPGRATGGVRSPAPATGGASPATPPTILTPQGPQVPATSGQGYQQIAPSPGQPGGIVIPNGNGTSTLIKPDGSVVTIPTPK